MKRSPDVAVILVNWNGKALTRQCIRSLMKSDTYGSRIPIPHIIVVDNASTDGSADDLPREFPDIHFLPQRQNTGFAGGNNIGIRCALASGFRYVWLLNNDTEIAADTCRKYHDAASEMGPGVYGSKIYFSPGREYHHDRYRDEDRGRVLWYAGGILDRKNFYASHRGVDEVDRGQYDTAAETDFITGCSMFIPVDVIRTVGMFDEKFFMYYEDVDFCLRAKAKGFRLRYLPAPVIWHYNAGTSGSGSTLHEYYQTRNRILLAMRYASLRTKAAILRESFRFLRSNSEIKRSAVRDALHLKFGVKS